ncbi:MAG: LysE family translocator [Hyphomonadaceae bacterium]
MPPLFPQFLFTALAIELTPGPNMTWLALLAARRGLLVGYMAVLGVALGLALLSVLTAIGVATVMVAYPFVHDIVRWAGIIFLFYLSIEAWFGLDKLGMEENPGAHGFWRGFVVNLLNPKAAVVFVVLIPNNLGPYYPSIIWLLTYCAAYVAIATIVHLTVVLFASQFTAYLSNPVRETTVRRVAGLVLLATAVWFALSTDRRDIASAAPDYPSASGATSLQPEPAGSPTALWSRVSANHGRITSS